PTFSTCFGAPFMPRPPTLYARLLESRIAAADSSVWLVNTVWTGGPYGEGQRMAIAETRRMVSAILAGELEGVPLRREPWFGLEVPSAISGVRASLLEPRTTWKEPARYDREARALSIRFQENFK